jgi:hypothetical protein
MDESLTWTIPHLAGQSAMPSRKACTTDLTAR